MMAERPQYQFKKIAVNTGQLRTPIRFIGAAPNDGPEPGESGTELLFECLGLAYSPSAKDQDYLTSHGAKLGVTIKIRDTAGEYDPSAEHMAVIDDRRYYKNGRPITWKIKQVAPDFEDNRFVKIVLGVDE
ncbi:hypothetical protein [Loigolactobacillus jiayinensis]|uniref:Uncharacterized protein n=1 Tax=Loigolactobacillus jiayinensis TaxID=2486016 RepID=A0ABW1RCS1_9LACO|nr:hypothetical protein [Loigolactobacillus jiayinensis]